MRYCVGCSAERPVADFEVNELSGEPTAWCRECQAAPVATVAAARPVAARSGAPRVPKAPPSRLVPTRTAERGSSRPPVLVINSYAGSLLLAARTLGVDVLGSYEDAGFGQRWQVANFPEHEGLFASERALWPNNPLDDAVVIAHPPCAAFSNQAKGTDSKHAKAAGADSEHFKCTVEVLEYAMSLRAAAVLVESVQGALEGGRAAHDAKAAEHGYRVFRILQNAATFGLPQWRPRFWVIFLRDDLPKRMAFVHRARCVPVGRFLEEAAPEDVDPRESEWHGKQEAFLVANGLTEAQAREAMTIAGVRLPHALRRVLGTGEAEKDLAKRFCFGAPIRFSKNREPRTCGWMSEVLRNLSPDGLAPTLMHNSWWAYAGRTLAPSEYRALMGFPRDYALDGQYRMWLSKGVCPPVAAWVLDSALRAVEGERSLPDRAHWLEAGETLDLEVDKGTWAEMAGVPRAERPDRGTVPRVPRAPRPPAAPRPAGGGKARRVTLAYRFTLASAFTEAHVVEAFASRREVVCQPLASWTPNDERTFTATLQYEPPNAGGSRSDVDRIAERGRRALEANGYGPVTVEPLR